MRSNMDYMGNIGRTDHPVIMDGMGKSITIKGFEGKLGGSVFMLPSSGRNYLEYGITDGSILLCSDCIKPADGDLVIKMIGKTPTVYILRPGSKETSEGTMRVLGDPAEVDAVIISSFNFYQ